MEWDIKFVFSCMAIMLTLVAFLPYLFSIIRGQTRPHVFTWVIWGLTTLIVFFAQYEARAGWGAWPIGISGGMTILVAVAAYCKRADASIHAMDWVFLLAALSSLPFWYVMSDPMWAVILLTTVDMLGFGPTLRKAYTFPDQENATFFVLFILRNTLVLLALEEYSIATALFPFAVNIGCFALLFLVVFRRYQLRTFLKQ
ncbi:hypothetical protein [Marinomonas sp. TW1]|uniref:hypothetical protein n=1 Tax=Marinomonas sp. TW1 TaxID=1561203 RepID=UPI0007AFB365|nr:hypothetical protein [Marinomonas sp. TW1]KZN14736.1 membrane protein [Marinomonas sp. TW1]